MQRHKRSLDFLESPFESRKRYMSPVLAARRPYLASAIPAKELNSKWVSPQCQHDHRETGILPFGKRRRCTKDRKRQALQSGKPIQDLEKEGTNIFPKLDFVSCQKNETTSGGESQNKLLLRRSKRIKYKTSIAQSKRYKNNQKENKLFLFSLGSPRSPVVEGEILAHETPEDQIAWSHLKRLRSKRK